MLIHLYTLLVLTLLNFAEAAKGFLLSFFLLRRHGHSLQHRLLAYLVALMAAVVLWSLLLLTGAYQPWPGLVRIADPLTLLFGPLLYFHVYAATRGKMPRGAWIHLIPFAVYVITIIPYYAISGAEKVALMDRAREGTLGPVVATIIIVRILHMMLYSAIGLVMLRRFRRVLRSSFPAWGIGTCTALPTSWRPTSP